MKAKLITRRYIVCPHCNEDSHCSADHLLEDAKKTNKPYNWGPWRCNECSKSFIGTIDPQGEVEVEIHGDSSVPCMTLLVIPPSDKPMFLLRNDIDYSPKAGNLQERKRFHYESHSCPTNWMEKFAIISVNRDGDPHGAIEFVRTIDQKQYDDVVNQVRDKYDLGENSSHADADQEILETAFPEVKILHQC